MNGPLPGWIEGVLPVTEDVAGDYQMKKRHAEQENRLPDHPQRCCVHVLPACPGWVRAV